MSHRKDTDYLAISARIRAMENRLLTRERMDRIIDARDDAEARKVLTECAHVVMKSNAKDTDLKLKGLRIASRGGKIARKKAIGAVARGLAVRIVALLKDPEREYVPLSEEGRRGFERYRAEQEHLAMRKDRRQATGAVLV